MAAKREMNLLTRSVWLLLFVTLAYLNVDGLLSANFDRWFAIIFGLVIAAGASCCFSIAARTDSVITFSGSILFGVVLIVVASLCDGNSMATTQLTQNAVFVSSSTEADVRSQNLSSARARLEKSRQAYLETMGKAEERKALAEAYQAEMDRQTDPSKVSDPTPGAQWKAARDNRDREASAAAGLFATGEALRREVETLQDLVRELEGEALTALASSAGEGERRFSLLALVEKQTLMDPKQALVLVCATIGGIFEAFAAFLAWHLGQLSRKPARRAATPRAPRKVPVVAPGSVQEPREYGGPLIPPAVPEKPVRRQYGGRSVRPEEN